MAAELALHESYMHRCWELPATRSIAQNNKEVKILRLQHRESDTYRMSKENTIKNASIKNESIKNESIKGEKNVIFKGKTKPLACWQAAVAQGSAVRRNDCVSPKFRTLGRLQT